MPRNAKTKRLQPVGYEDLEKLMGQLNAAIRKLKPIVETLKLDPTRTVDADGKKQSDTGIANVGKFISSCDAKLGL